MTPPPPPPPIGAGGSCYRHNFTVPPQELEAAGLCHDGAFPHAEVVGLVLTVMAEHCHGKQSRYAGSVPTPVCIYNYCTAVTAWVGSVSVAHHG